MAKLSYMEQALYSDIARGDIRNAQNILKSLLRAQKYSTDDCAQRLITQLETQQPVSIPDKMQEYLTITQPENIDIGFHYDRDIEEEVVKDIRKTAENAEALSRMGIKAGNATLLYGKPGTGKTVLANLIAKELALPLISVKSSSLVSCKLGETGHIVTSVFDYIRNTRCVFFIDEIDFLGMKRGSDKEVAEMSRVLISLMQMIDTLPAGFVIVAATNREDMLDEALLRRFSRQIKVEGLSYAQACELTLKLLNHVYPDSFSEVEIASLFSQDGTYNPARICNTITREIVRAWPERVNLACLNFV